MLLFLYKYYCWGGRGVTGGSRLDGLLTFLKNGPVSWEWRVHTERRLLLLRSRLGGLLFSENVFSLFS